MARTATIKNGLLACLEYSILARGLSHRGSASNGDSIREPYGGPMLPHAPAPRESELCLPLQLLLVMKFLEGSLTLLLGKIFGTRQPQPAVHPRQAIGCQLSKLDLMRTKLEALSL